MRNYRLVLSLILAAAIFHAIPAHARTSAINPNVPAQNSPLSSSVLRGNFLAGYNDANDTFGSLILTSNQLVGSLAGGLAIPLNVPACSPASGNALGWTNGVGLVCTAVSGAGGGSSVSLTAGNAGIVVSPSPCVGTCTISLAGPSGTTLGGVQSTTPVSHQFLTGINTSGVVAQAQPACGDLSDAGTACAKSTGSSGSTVPLLNGNNTWSGTQALNGYVTVGAGISVTPVALTISGSAFATNAALGTLFYATLPNSAATTASAPTNPSDGQIMTYELTQGNSGSGTITWNAAFDFGTAGAPILTTTANKIDLVAFRYSVRNSKWNYLGNGLGF